VNRTSTINALIADTPCLWRGREPNRSQGTLATGHKPLDARLPGGGWPLGAVTELITGQPGLGEFSLLFPVLSQVSRNGQWLILIDPPWIPYPAALHGRGLALDRLLLVRTGKVKESLWACEQALRGSQGGAVLAWPKQAGFARLRRLQLAAEAGAKLAFLFHPEQALTTASPAALRLYLQGGEAGTRIDILKCRGNRPSEPIWIPRPHTCKISRPGDLQRAQHSNTHILQAVSDVRVPLPASTSLN
jgi:cell division inhibitor SulA/protein ImuA